MLRPESTGDVRGHPSLVRRERPGRQGHRDSRSGRFRCGGRTPSHDARERNSLYLACAGILGVGSLLLAVRGWRAGNWLLQRRKYDPSERLVASTERGSRGADEALIPMYTSSNSMYDAPL